MSAIYLPDDVRKLLFGKNVVIIGDSVQRSIYKDLVLLIQDRRYLTQKELRKKGEESFIGDELVEGGVKGEMSNSVNYREVRHYKYDKSNINVRYFFVTIVYGEYTDSVIKKNSDADVVIMNSCLWDVHRYGEKGLKNYEDNLKKLIDVVKKECRKAIFLWGTTPPVHLKSKGGFLALPGVDVVKINDVKRCNHIAMQVVSEAGFHFVDFDHVFGYFLHHRADDGVHWNEKAHRRMTNMLMEEIARIWNKPVPRPLKDDDEYFAPLPEDGILPTPGGDFIEPDFRGPGPPFGPPIGPGMPPHFRPLEREAIFYRPRFPHDAEGEFFPPPDFPEIEMEFYGERRFPPRMGLEFEDGFGPRPEFHGPDFQDFDRELYERERFHARFGPPGPFRCPGEPAFVDLDEREAFFRMRPNREGMEDFTEDVDLNEPRMRFPEGFRGAPFPDDPGFRQGRFPPMAPRFPNNGLHVEPGIGAGMKRKLNEANGPRSLPPLMPELAGFGSMKRPRFDENADTGNRKVNDAKGKVTSSPVKPKEGDSADDTMNNKGFKSGNLAQDHKPSGASASVYGDCSLSGGKELVTTPDEEKPPLAKPVAEGEEKEPETERKPEFKPNSGDLKDKVPGSPKGKMRNASAGNDVVTSTSGVSRQAETTYPVQEPSTKSNDTVLADPKGSTWKSANLPVVEPVLTLRVGAKADLTTKDPLANKQDDTGSVKAIISGSLPSDAFSVVANPPGTSTTSITAQNVSSLPATEDWSTKTPNVSESKGIVRDRKSAMQESPTRIGQNGRQFALAPLPKHISPIKPSKSSYAKSLVFGTPEKQQAILSEEKSVGPAKGTEVQQGIAFRPFQVSESDEAVDDLPDSEKSLTALPAATEEKTKSEFALPTSNTVASIDPLPKSSEGKPIITTEMKEDPNVAPLISVMKEETEATVVTALQDETLKAAPEKPSTPPSEVATSIAREDIPSEEKPATKTVTKPVLKLLPKPKVADATGKNKAGSSANSGAADAGVSRIPTMGTQSQGVQDVKSRQGKRHQRSATYTPAMRSNMPRPSYPAAQALPPQHPSLPINNMQPALYDHQQYQQPVGGGHYPDLNQMPHFQPPIGQQQQHVTSQQPHPSHAQMLLTHPQHLAHPQSHTVHQEQSVEQSMLPRQGESIFTQTHYQTSADPPTLSTNVALQQQQQQQQMYYEQLQQAELARQAREQENARLAQLEEQQRQQYLQQQQLHMQGAQAAFTTSQQLTQQQMELVLKARQELQERKYQQAMAMQQQQLQTHQHIHPQQLSAHQQIQLQAERFQRQQQLLLLQMSSTSADRGHNSSFESNSSSDSESGSSREEERQPKRESRSRHGDSRHHGSSSKSRRRGHGEGTKRTSRSRDHHKHSSRDRSGDRKRDRDRTHKERKGRKKERDRDRRDRSRSDHRKSRKNEGSDSQYDNEYFQHLLKRVGGVL